MKPTSNPFDGVYINQSFIIVVIILANFLSNIYIYIYGLFNSCTMPEPSTHYLFYGLVACPPLGKALWFDWVCSPIQVLAVATPCGQWQAPIVSGD